MDWTAELALLALPALTLATSGPAGEPHAAAVYFAALPHGDDAMRLYFFSAPGSQHAADLHRSPQAAAALYPLVEGWQAIRGLQLRGRALPVPEGGEWEAAWDGYATKFPFVAALQAEVRRSTLYVFIPEWVRLVDNRRGFGYKEEWTIP